MVSTEFKGVGLHYTAFRDAIREDSRQTTPSRGVTPRKKFAVEANVESRVKQCLFVLGKASEWTSLLESLRLQYPKKRNLMAILDELA